MEIFDGAPAPDDGMDPEEVLRRSEAFDIMPELQRIKDANLSAEETLARQVSAALSGYNAAMRFQTPNREAIMRLALQMIVDYETRTEPVTEWYKGYTSGLNQARKIAEQALRECS